MANVYRTRFAALAGLRNVRALCFQVDRVQRLAGRHEQAVPLRAAEAEVSAEVGQVNPVGEFSVGAKTATPSVAGEALGEIAAAAYETLP